MSRKWQREQAHRKAEMLGIKHPNKMMYFQGKPIGSWFANNWRKIGSVTLPKPQRKKREAS